MAVTDRAMFANRRAARRYDLDSTVEISVAGGSFGARSEDISTGGMRLHCEGVSVQAGDTIGISLRLPEIEYAIEIQGTVCWVDRICKEIFGVSFSTGLRAREVWAITRLKPE